MNGFNFKKSLGQNFLQNQDIAEVIVSLGEIKNDDTIIEIGCGDGLLSEKILDFNPQKLIIIEIDERCINLTKNRLQKHQNFNKLQIVHADGCDFLIRDFSCDKVKIIANLPYSVGTKIMFNLLCQTDKILKMVLMFQKEVAERIVALHNNKNYGTLSIASQLCFKSEIEFDIPPAFFNPQPKVMSSVIVCNPSLAIDIAKVPNIINFSKNIFLSRRKMLRSYLKLSEKNVKLYGAKRAENLTPAEIFDIMQNP